MIAPDTARGPPACGSRADGKSVREQRRNFGEETSRGVGRGDIIDEVGARPGAADLWPQKTLSTIHMSEGEYYFPALSTFRKDFLCF
ncbi:hypothetical protein EVAR_14882_1 [Eumeta japonica]|uniref:Uncharacterized protein n=1 Tax=Eumeta variegata TaxID=151549 RepID=A0A4C1V340_EUMVA|nr:hypothetical protein EVAR_14882_1 [Eumeta japonica]